MMKNKRKIFLGLLSAYIALCFVGMKFYDAAAAADYASAHTLRGSHTWCAAWVMKGLWHGGCFVGLYPAWMYKYVLPLYGFDEVKPTYYQKGDIVVYPAVGKHIWGHIAIYDGKQWVSDFKQKHLIVAPTYRKVEPTFFRNGE